MKFEKKFLMEQNRCYATGSIQFNGQTLALLATEGAGACNAFSGVDYGTQTAVWTEPGGTMTFAPLPGTNGEFLTIQKFFKMFQWEEATLVWVRPQQDGSFQVSELFKLPYLHRFDVLESNGHKYFIGCTLAEHKDAKDDWSFPGKVYVADLPDDLASPMQLNVLIDSLYQNHGFAKVVWNGRNAAMVGSRDGALIITPPQDADSDWTVEKIMDQPVSDLAAIDIDGDGELEIATIEPFHGSYYRIYKKIGGKYQQIFEHPEVSEFYHVVTGAELRGKPVFIGGCRRGKMQLFYVTASTTSPLSLEAVLIDEGVGPSNVSVIHEKNRDVLVSANREKGEAALYFVTD